MLYPSLLPATIRRCNTPGTVCLSCCRSVLGPHCNIAHGQGNHRTLYTHCRELTVRLAPNRGKLIGSTAPNVGNSWPFLQQIWETHSTSCNKYGKLTVRLATNRNSPIRLATNRNSLYVLPQIGELTGRLVPNRETHSTSFPKCGNSQYVLRQIGGTHNTSCTR